MSTLERNSASSAARVAHRGGRRTWLRLRREQLRCYKEAKFSLWHRGHSHDRMQDQGTRRGRTPRRSWLTRANASPLLSNAAAGVDVGQAIYYTAATGSDHEIAHGTGALEVGWGRCISFRLLHTDLIQYVPLKGRLMRPSDKGGGLPGLAWSNSVVHLRSLDSSL
jgi:hypothetical protein